MGQERLSIHLSQEVHPLFSQGTLIHVTGLGVLEDALLGDGLLSPCKQAERDGKTIPEDTSYHPRDNVNVKFLRLPSLDYRGNCSKLIGHFSEFTFSYELPIGFMVRNNKAILMFKEHPITKNGGDHYGIRDTVSPQEIEGIIISTGIDVEDTSWLDSSRGQTILGLVLNVVRQTQEKQKRKIPVLDNFGRELLQEE